MTRRILIMFAVLALVAVALGFYALHLKRKVARDAQTASEQQLALAPQSNGPPEPVTLYVADDNDGTLHKTQVSVAMPVERSERARATLRTLLTQYLKSGSTHPIGKMPTILTALWQRCCKICVGQEDGRGTVAHKHPHG